MFTLCARVVIRIKHSLQVVSNEDCHQFMVYDFASFATVFSTVPAKTVFAMAKTQHWMFVARMTDLAPHIGNHASDSELH